MNNHEIAEIVRKVLELNDLQKQYWDIEMNIDLRASQVQEAFERGNFPKTPEEWKKSTREHMERIQEKMLKIKEFLGEI